MLKNRPYSCDSLSMTRSARSRSLATSPGDDTNTLRACGIPFSPIAWRLFLPHGSRKGARAVAARAVDPNAGCGAVTMVTQSTSWLGLDGRICVITGAGGGIGRATALAFAAAGAHVVLLDRDAANLAETARQVAAEGGKEAIVVPCDVADAASVEAAAGTAERAAGACDILMNNAGILR